MKKDAAASVVLSRVAEALAEAFDTDAQLHALLAKLQQLGLTVGAHLTLLRGSERPVVTVEDDPATVPEWSAADQELLRSLGIAIADGQPRRRPAKPSRRQPR